MKFPLATMALLLLISCSDAPTALPPGSIRVTTATVGGDPDQDGYSLVIGSRRIAIGPSATVALDDISAATHVLSLEGVADNCTLTGDPSRSITVQSGAIADVLFHIACDATGVEITTRTAGVDRPLGTYTVATGDRSSPVHINDIIGFGRLQPGSHKVSLNGIPANCQVTTENPVTVAVVYRAVTRVTFDITCSSVDKRIVFVRDTTLAGGLPVTGIFAADGSASTLVSLTPGHSPAWSADGTRILYSDAHCDYYYYNSCSGGLRILDLDTRTSTTVAGGELGDFPSWSPDGSSIAFSKILGSFSQVALLHVLRVDGSPAVQIATDGMQALHPSWSPDGKRIVFTCVIGSLVQHEICTINRDGTGFLRLTNDAATDRDPAWSPDGSRIAFTTNRFNPGINDIALMTPTGTGITRLTQGSEPAWLPDGQNLIFASTNGLFRIRPDGSGLTRLTTGRHRAPAWRP